MSIHLHWKNNLCYEPNLGGYYYQKTHFCKRQGWKKGGKSHISWNICSMLCTVIHDSSTFRWQGSDWRLEFHTLVLAKSPAKIRGELTQQMGRGKGDSFTTFVISRRVSSFCLCMYVLAISSCYLLQHHCTLFVHSCRLSFTCCTKNTAFSHSFTRSPTSTSLRLRELTYTSENLTLLF